MNTSSTWPSRTSTTAEPRQEARKPTASASASTKPSCRSSIRWRSANGSTPASSSCRLTSIPGSPGTTNSDYIRGAGVTARRQCKPSLTPSHSPGRNQWPPDVGQTQPFRHQTGQLSDQVSATTPYELHDIGNLDLEEGGTIRGCTLAYATLGTLNAAADNAILIPTWYSGTNKIMEQVYIGKGRALDPDKYFIIVVNQIGNGLSTSPHNTPAPAGMGNFPHVRIGDDVRAQHKFVTQKFGLTSRWLSAAQWALSRPTNGRYVTPTC